MYKAFGVWKSDGSVRFDGQEVSLDEVRETIESISPITREWKKALRSQFEGRPAPSSDFPIRALWTRRPSLGTRAKARQ